jgi:hypothetical protein
MKNTISILLVLIITLFAARAQNLAVNNASKSLFDSLFSSKCDSILIYTAVLKSQTGQHLFSESRYKKYYNSALNRLMFNNSGDRKRFEEIIVSEFNQLSQEEQTQILSISYSWCKYSIITDSILLLNNAYLEEVLFNIPRAKPLFKKYIFSKKQTWESLSLWQVEDLFQNFMDYLYGLSEHMRNEFLVEFAATAKKMHRKD